jgi:hypothetical protein
MIWLLLHSLPSPLPSARPATHRKAEKVDNLLTVEGEGDGKEPNYTRARKPGTLCMPHLVKIRMDLYLQIKEIFVENVS